MVKVAIIILNWKQPQLTIQTINSLLKIKKSGFSYHIYLVDGHSPDNSYSQFKASYQNNPLITLLQTPFNMGYSGGNNFAIRAALKKNYDYLLVANNDILVDPDFLIHLINRAKSNPKLGIIGPKIYFAPGYEFHQNRYSKKDLGKVIWAFGGSLDWPNVLGSNYGVDQVDTGQYNIVHTPDFVSGCCLLLSAPMLKKIGLFNQDYFMYFEDVELSIRALKSGYQLIIEPKSIIWHLCSASSAIGSNLVDYFTTRNRLIFGFRYASPKSKFALFRESIRFLFNGRPWQRQGVMDYYLKRFGVGSWQ